MAKNEVAILGVGMHPWGKWGRNFVEYGVHAIQAALKDADLDWRKVEFIAGGDTMLAGCATGQIFGTQWTHIGSGRGNSAH